LIVEAWKSNPAANAWVEYYIGKNGNDPYAAHNSVMAALGRIDDTEDLLATARIIAERKMSTKAAVALLRCIRSNREDKLDFIELVNCIETAINSYCEAHPATTMPLIVRALRELADEFEER
jgi:hypothetical protein